MREEIKLPKRIGVRDYHDFTLLQECFKILCRQIRVKEIGCNGQEYIGIVYVGNLEEPENRLLVDKISKELRAFNNE